MANERAYRPCLPSDVAWVSREGQSQHAADDEVAAEVDEPPDLGLACARTQFKRNVVPKIAEHSESLLTKALHQTDADVSRLRYGASPTRRRSMTSNISFASTADLTSDTGFTSPARTNTPSPPPPMIRPYQLDRGLSGMLKQHVVLQGSEREVEFTKPISPPSKMAMETNDTAQVALPKKRCISFACGPRPERERTLSQAQPQPAEAHPASEEKPQRKSCIKFACPTKPVPSPGIASPGHDLSSTPAPNVPKVKPASPVSSRKHRSSSANRGRSQRSSTPRPEKPAGDSAPRSKYLTADASDLDTESSRFHEFASDEPVQEDWIRQGFPNLSTRLTINDTLRKENEIRRLGKEAEEEALEEEEEDEYEDGDIYGDDTDLVGLDEDEDGDDDDAEDEDALDQSGSESDGVGSDGYNTDNEVGFADSDDEEDGDLQLWTPVLGLALAIASNDTPRARRRSLRVENSDTSSSEGLESRPRIRKRSRRTKSGPRTPELPDSTDFVCGTLDEDRVLENAYISCIASKRREKLHLIPQDIDPSFPTSEPEDEELRPHRRIHDTTDNLWIAGEMEDIDHNGDRGRRKSGHTSPWKYRSPPPKGRGRSPRRLFDRYSPRRLVSPPPPGRATRSPPASLVQASQFQQVHFKSLAFQPGLTHTKSLPRAPALFPPHIKIIRKVERQPEYSGHVRGAIDIVKGLEQKRQRRREKFKEKYLQKHNEKARKGQLPQQRPQPGQGAQRMREIGLLSAGKRDPDQYVLSV
ncbi:hypothetical protein F5Y17DRAFT_354367 [Xylariaceae sp. FL0594]|nr:hypothetical protein F5Y17DRAFT_354367 [Xylariaceae sp. FL0594]